STTGYRTLYPAISPRGAANIHTIDCLAAERSCDTAAVAGTLSSLLIDFVVRASGKSHLYGDAIGFLPSLPQGPERSSVITRSLRLNCLTSAYAPLWEEVTGTEWTPDVPLRKGEERRQAQVEIDALVELALGVTADEL